MTTVRSDSHLVPHSLEFLRVVTEFVGILVEILYCEYARTCIFDAFLCRKMTQVILSITPPTFLYNTSVAPLLWWPYFIA